MGIKLDCPPPAGLATIFSEMKLDNENSTLNASKSPCVFYRDLFGGWRWEWRDSDGNIRDSQHSYETREECVEAARRLDLCESDPAPLRAKAAPPLEGRAILCAYPDPQVERFLRQTLQSAALVFASTGREALKALNTSVYDAFLLDYWLPDWSGVSFCREIRKSDPHVPICFYTKAQSDDAKKRALRAGADLFLSVPVEPQTLRARLQTLITSRDANTIRAEAEENRAIQEELHRRAQQAKNIAASGRESAARAIERGARARAMKAFVESGGTRANFERLWPQAYVDLARTSQL